MHERSHRLISEGECSGLSATIDAASRYHVASVCDGQLRYLTSADGRTWTAVSFPPPPDRIELYPQLAVDGDVVHLAYTRIAQGDGACGDPGLTDLGVYVRSRQVPNGAWTEPVRVGSQGDRLQGFRAVDGVLHLTVATASGDVVYEAQAGQALTRVVIPDAITTSLRVGDDSRARIAYATGHAIRYARVEGTQLSIVTVAATDETYLKTPSLVLGPGDRAYVLWMQDVNTGGGCVEVGPGPLDGAYIGTDATGHWVTSRLTDVPNAGSLTLDPSTGRLHVIVDRVYFTAQGDGPWTSLELTGTETFAGYVIRLDPATARPVVFGILWRDTNGIGVLDLAGVGLDGLDEGDIGG